MSEQTMSTTMTRTMPTEADAPEIQTIAMAYTGSKWIHDATATSGGVLVRYAPDANSPAPALEAVGYSTVLLRRGLVLITGATDELARLEEQISVLTRRRDELVSQRTVARVEEEMGGPF